MTILAIDTSTTRGSVALVADGTVRLEENFTADRSHSASLFTVLEKVRALVEQIDVVAIGLGPGSYAGVRIAISAAIGFRLGLGARLVGLSSVVALETDAASYLAVGDARRDTFYLTRVTDGVALEGPRLVLANELRTIAEHDADWPIFTPTPLDLLPRATVALPSARRLATLAAAGTSIIAEGTLEPLYLREPHITQPRKRPL